ncbi:bi-domain-containing oxidoreductase [Butyrivibrio sp. AE3004]|uniref:bi-domain-containing oxidoreductase n=1 Tax=Butyrivibrio sp. AE3004 TaxID=1506994 RepID=UPI000494446E|nr:bi-domain-containing oxidoreductase [Butyrivibrio sp. AE3004]
MKQLFLSVKDGSVNLIETPPPTVKDNTVVIESMYSVISAGTERMLASFGNKNLVQKALERPDQVKKVTEKMSTDGVLTTLEAAFGKLKDPMPMGYSAVGKVVEVGRGVTGICVGDIVAAVGQAYHSEINRVGKNMIAKVPDEITDIRQCAFAALGGIALEGIHQAEIMPGESVAVIGLGLLGHITARILYAYGCDVIGFDVADKTLEGTRLKAFIRSDDDNAADKVKNLTYGRGVDKVIITASTDSNGPIDLAEAITRDRAVITMIGVTRMELDRRSFYQKELSFRIARSYGAGRYDSSYEEDGVDYPIGYVRFTEGRNVEEYLRLLATDRLDISDIITHEFSFDNATNAYEMITKNQNKENYIGVLLKYDFDATKYESTIIRSKKVKIGNGKINVGMIGAGSFARSVILPTMKDNGKYNFVGLATTGGTSAAQASATYSFNYITSDYKKLLDDKSIDLIVVSTQHNSHAKFIIEALEAGKNVYCEKPLCLMRHELDEIEQAYHKSQKELFCGLNRRHAPLIQEIRKELKTDKIPAVYVYTVNAGFVPADHWTQNVKKGGGRIIGEAVHFIDTIQSLDGSKIDGINIEYADNSAYPMNDNAIITLKFQSGAVGNVIYTSMGSKRYPKETLCVFSSGGVYELRNYTSLIKYTSNKKSTIKLKQDKGIKMEYEYIYDVINNHRNNNSIISIISLHKRIFETIKN